MTNKLASSLLLALTIGLIVYGIAAHSEIVIVDCVTARDRDHIRELTLQAIDNAMQHHVERLYDIWLKDFSPEPKRAMVGMANGLSAYQRARANANNWNPPVCP